MKLRKYIRESTDKFKKDALSKLIYDFFKWLIPFLFLFANTHWFKGNINQFDFLFNNYNVSLYWIILYSLLLIIVTILVVNYIFRKKYNRLLTDNFTDELTGLKNYKSLKQNLGDIIKSSNSQPLSLILLDIDDFKKFNTDTSHNTADQILKKIGELLKDDKRATDETYRYFLRGDEFLVITKLTNQSQAFQAAERKRDLIANTFFEVGGKTHRLTVSCGVTQYKIGDDYDSFTDRVSKALNLAKAQKSKNCTKAYS